MEPWAKKLFEACGFTPAQIEESERKTVTYTARGFPPLSETERREILERYGFDPDKVLGLEYLGMEFSPGMVPSLRYRPIYFEDAEK